MVQVEKLHEEGPQLKLLQASLTLLQCPALIQNEVRKCMPAAKLHLHKTIGLVLAIHAMEQLTCT